jgi:hypothetical protein
MNRTIQLLNGAVALFFVSASCFTGCAPADPADGEEQIEEAQQAQVDPGEKAWRQVTLTFSDLAATPFATIYVFNKTLNGYKTGIEYWYVNLGSVDMIGQYSLDIVSTDQRATVFPPPPRYDDQQGFSLPEFPESGWGEWWSSDPVNEGSLYSGPDQISLRLTTAGSPARLDSVTWYQVIASTATAYNITPSGNFTLGAPSVQVPSGYRGYNVSQTTP